MLYELYFQRPPTGEETSAGLEFVREFQPGDVPAAPAPASGAKQCGRRGGRGGAQGEAVAAGRPRPAAPVRVPLNAWQDIRHALLLTNEAAFVN